MTFQRCRLALIHLLGSILPARIDTFHLFPFARLCTQLTMPTCVSIDASFLSVKLQFPFTFLLQKVCLEESNKTYAEPFNIEMITKHAVTHGPIRSALHETEIIDFKKNKIDWRFKTRMRSNSNEFLESPLAFMQKNQED